MENARDLSQNDNIIILGYIIRLLPRILMEDKLGYPLKPDEDAHYKYHYQVS